tara:strand:- start:61409 stop:63538 length:2130 start_codon:yes stop_codon:yes gene_type:complete
MAKVKALNFTRFFFHILCVFFLLYGVINVAQGQLGVSIEDVAVSSVEGNNIHIKVKLSDTVPIPKSFILEEPAKIVLDFPGVRNRLPLEQSRVEYNLGNLKRVSVVEADGRTRMVLDLNESVPYEVSASGQEINITVAGSNIPTQKIDPFQGQLQGKNWIGGGYTINDVDFRRGYESDGHIIIDLSDRNIPIDLKEEGSQIRLLFMGASLPPHLERKLEVTDFGTPVVTVNAVQQGNDVEMIIKTTGHSDHIAYQADNRFTVEVRPLTKAEKDAQQEKAFEYTGERLSLNFQEIEVRAVLQLIADFTGLNIVSSDTVRGSVTLRLRNVPWDQALDIIMKTKGLAKRQVGNVLLVGPSEEIAAREKLELQTNQQVKELAPLNAEYIQINYAKASELASLLKDEDNSLLSARGTVSVDERTNTLLVQDTRFKIEDVRKLVHRLDVPVRQVLIEARVVFANDDFEDALGVKFGAALKFRPGQEPILGLAGDLLSSAGIAQAANSTAAVAATNPLQRLAVDLPVSLPGGDGATGVGLTIASLPGGTILDLELEALESEGLGKIVASPRIVTSNQQQAYIEAGEEIPYLQSSSSGATSIAFKKAVLRLEVTPQITPDDNVILELTVNQDSRGVVTSGVPSINTREMHTKVLVQNGETVVLGGIYQQEKNDKVRRVPFFGNLPLVGWLFKSRTHLDKRSELLIFVTPKIIQEGVT